MRVTAVQFKARDDRRAGLAALASRVAEVGRDSDLVVCPEMAVAGYAWSDADALRPVAETVDGPTARALGEAARASGAWVVCGFPERAGDRLFNSALVIDPSGAVRFVYRKTLLFEADETWASPGDSGYRAFDTAAGRFGVGICMDLNDDRFLDWCGREGLDVLAFPTNWVQDDGSVWDYWRWRLYTAWPEESGVEPRMAGRRRVDAVLVGANSYGPEGRYVLRGESAILSWREVYATAEAVGDAALTVHLAR
ncbi:MAG: carbon-nitrogen hydrolase family protein [Alphaproteobacteria bacterium]|nr:carbon-nitrogen hydrolase family protein [Alphaproteobacteria bacterium]